MVKPVAPFGSLAIQNPIHARAVDFNPAFSPWLLIPGAIIAVIAVFYLYRAQRQIASRKIVNSLMTIRIALVLLVIALLLGPVRQWSYTRHSSGTLYLLLDQSQSMRQKDPQATDAELLCWADALGYLPADLQPGHAAVGENQLLALRSDLAFLRASFDRVAADDSNSRQKQSLATALTEWQKNLVDCATALEGCPQAAGIPGNLRSAAFTVANVQGLISWQTIDDMLSKAIAQIHPVAAAEEKDFLAKHRNDSHVREAFDKVKQMDRAQLALDALTSRSTHGLKTLSEMIDRQDVKLVPFGDHNTIASPARSDLHPAIQDALRKQDGRNTNIAGALKFVSEQVGDDSTAVVISDGRQNVGSDPEAPARALAARGVRVFTLTLGSHQLARDAAVDHVDAPDWVYADDEVVISPVIKLDGLRGQNVTVQLLRGKDVVDTRQLKAATDQDKQRLRLSDHPPSEGVYDYSVVILPVPNEAVAGNNRQSVRVSVKKQRVNVLLVEDDPGWEYQFLRNYLARDHRVKLQAVLLNPGHIENVQQPSAAVASPTAEEGKIDAQSLPITKEKWAGFDIVIMGDVPPEEFPVEQQINVLAALKNGSVKALLLLAGQRNMPMRYAAAPLADAIPVSMSNGSWTPQILRDQVRHGFIPLQATDGFNSVLAQFSEDSVVNTALWANMPAWFWHSEQTTARPGASVIWSIHDASADNTKPSDSADEYQSAREHALLATMNVGLGRVMYLASPQTWRLRYVQTPGTDSHIEDVHRRFWGQVVRWAVGDDLPAGGKFVKFGTNKHSYVGGESVIITARVLKEDLSPLQDDSFKMTATTDNGSVASEAEMVPAPSEGAGIYRGSVSLPAGSYNLSLRGGQAERLLSGDDSVSAAQKTLRIEVEPNATLEDRDVNADPETMNAVARAGGGAAMDGAFFDVLASHLPVVNRDDTQVIQAGLFSDPNDGRTKMAHWVFFGLFVSLLATEWILRKRGGLV